MTPNRRTEHRREDDETSVIERDYESWVRKIVVHRGMGIALASLLTCVGTTAGYRFVGPAHDVSEIKKEVAHSDTAMRRRVDTLSVGLAAAIRRVETLENEVHFQNYLQCVQLKRTDPSAVPAECNAITLAGPRP